MSKIVTNQISPRSGDTVTVTNKLNVQGVLTYEDVTNIDSVGIVTAQQGVRISAGGLTVAGVSTTADIHVTSGNVGIATASPDNQLHVFGATTSAIKIETGDGDYNPIVIQENPDRTWHTGLRGDVSDSWVVRDATASSNRLVIDTSGRTLINTSSSIATEPDVQGYTPALQVVHAPSNAATNGVSINRFQAGNAFAPPLIFQKSRNDTIGSHTIVDDNDELGDISFAGSDGAAFRTAARINVDVDGTPGSSDMPGRIQFSTTAVGAATPTERLRVDSSGRMLIGASSPVAGADTNTRVQISQDVGSNTSVLAVENTASSGNISCIRARLRNSAPDSIFSAFLSCDDSSSGSKAVIRSNGGLANYSANNANLSDRNTKKDITLASDTWNSIKNWEIVNFRYKEQPDDADLNLGVIAQQIEEISPKMVTIYQEAKEATETEPAREQRLGVKEQQMQWMATKALQEAMARIEELEAKVAALEGS